VIVAHFASPAFSIALLYQVQFWIGLISAWAVCRHLGLNRWVTTVCMFTWALCSVSIQLQTDFWPDYWVVWMLAPLLLLLLLKLITSETRERRAFYSIASRLCSGLMYLDGFVGVDPVFALGFAAFLIGIAPCAAGVALDRPGPGRLVRCIVHASTTSRWRTLARPNRTTSRCSRSTFVTSSSTRTIWARTSPQRGVRTALRGARRTRPALSG
jgi:hypothetical protein